MASQCAASARASASAPRASVRRVGTGISIDRRVGADRARRARRATTTTTTTRAAAADDAVGAIGALASASAVALDAIADARDALTASLAGAVSSDVDVDVSSTARQLDASLADLASAHPALAGALAGALAAGVALATARVAGAGTSSTTSSSSSSESSSTGSSTSRADGVPEGLPTTYDVPAIRAYWSARPLASLSRTSSLVAKLATWLAGFLGDLASGAETVERNAPRRAAALRDLIASQGPAFVKVGQAVAIRPDLLPKAYLDALQELLDQVAPFSSEEARALVRAQLGGLDLEDVFEDVGAFDAPVAAASIGQVYKAKLRESAPGVDASEFETWGGDVAVKVQRPRILEVVTLDLIVIRSALEAAVRLPPIRPRSRGERRSLRTFPVVTLHPRFPFNV